MRVRLSRQGTFFTSVSNPGYGLYTYRASVPKSGGHKRAVSAPVTIASPAPGPAPTPAPPAPPVAPPAEGPRGGSQVPASEIQALVDLYNATDGPHWDYKPGWMSSDTVCSWWGVSCNSSAYDANGKPILSNHDAHVVALRLGFNDLRGAVPASIGQLTQLYSLDLFQEHLTEIPASVGNLSNLVELDLNDNDLASIPTEVGNLTKLTQLDISGNELAVIPASIGNLTNLINLLVINTGATSLPSSIGNLTKLKLLAASRNNFTSLPTTIGQMSALTYLQLSQNAITSLPTTVGNLSNLVELSADGNKLTSVPNAVGDLSSLTTLSLGGNNLSGDISGWAAGLKAANKMQNLSLGDGLNKGNHGLTVGGDTGLAQWLTALDSSWNEVS